MYSTLGLYLVCGSGGRLPYQIYIEPNAILQIMLLAESCNMVALDLS
jgi:hypothetical protein